MWWKPGYNKCSPDTNQMSLSIHMALNITNLFNNSLWRFGVHLFLQVMCRHKLHLPKFLITPRNEKTQPEWQWAHSQPNGSRYTHKPNLKQLGCHLSSLFPPTVPVTCLLWHLDPLALRLVSEAFIAYLKMASRSNLSSSGPLGPLLDLVLNFPSSVTDWEGVRGREKVPCHCLWVLYNILRNSSEKDNDQLELLWFFQWELDYKEGWASKNWCFWTLVLEKTLESPLDCKEIQPVHPKNPEYSLEGWMLKLKFQYFGHLMRRADSMEKTLMLGKIEGRSRRGQQRMRWWDSITNSMDMNLSKFWETVKDREVWQATVHEVPKSRTQLSNWTATTTN